MANSQTRPAHPVRRHPAARITRRHSGTSPALGDLGGSPRRRVQMCTEAAAPAPIAAPSQIAQHSGSPFGDENESLGRQETMTLLVRLPACQRAMLCSVGGGCAGLLAWPRAAVHRAPASAIWGPSTGSSGAICAIRGHRRSYGCPTSLYLG